MIVLRWIGSVALLTGAVVALLSAIGMWIMRGPMRRLHFVTPPATISAALLALAFWIEEPQKAVAGKVSFAVLVLLAVNGVVTHATARAVQTPAKPGPP